MREESQMRWEPCLNISGEVIPPYAMMEIRSDSGNEENREVYVTRERGGQAYWLVGKCSTSMLSAQNPALLCCNGPAPIPVGGYGICTQDWPARTLIVGSGGIFEGNLASGNLCGPNVDKWYVSAEGSAFTCVSWDVAHTGNDLRIDGTNLLAHVVWVSPFGRDITSRYAVFRMYGSVGFGESLTPYYLYPDEGLYGEAMPGVTTDGWDADGYGNISGFRINGSYLESKVGGLYLFGCYGILNAPSASHGDTVGFRVKTSGAPDFWETLTEVSAVSVPNIVDAGGGLVNWGNPAQTVYRTYQHLSCTGFINLPEGVDAVRRIWVTGNNTSNTYYNLRLWLLRIAQYRDHREVT